MDISMLIVYYVEYGAKMTKIEGTERLRPSYRSQPPQVPSEGAPSCDESEEDVFRGGQCEVVKKERFDM